VRRETDLQSSTASNISISIHSLREKGDCIRFHWIYFCFISIHSLREKGDWKEIEEDNAFKISIHSLREKGDFLKVGEDVANWLFQSTPFVRRETAIIHKSRIIIY